MLVIESVLRTDPKLEIAKVQKEIQIAVIDFNISHTYQASKVFLPKYKFELLLLSEGLINEGLFKAMKIFESIKFESIIVEEHPLETIKEIIVI